MAILYVYYDRAASVAKVGVTVNDPEIRIADYTRKHEWPGHFERVAEYNISRKAMYALEAAVHRVLADYRLVWGAAKELFKVGLDEVDRAVLRAAVDVMKNVECRRLKAIVDPAEREALLRERMPGDDGVDRRALGPRLLPADGKVDAKLKSRAAKLRRKRKAEAASRNRGKGKLWRIAAAKIDYDRWKNGPKKKRYRTMIYD